MYDAVYTTIIFPKVEGSVVFRLFVHIRMEFLLHKNANYWM